MDWKPIVIEELRQYEAKKQSLDVIPERIAYLESAMHGIRSASSDGSPVKGGGSGREDMYISNIVQINKLTLSLEQARKWVSTMDSCLNCLSKEERTILDRFYINPAKGNVDRLCGELGIEKPTVYRRKDDALRHLTICLYGCTEN